MAELNKRSIIVCILLSIITLGIYGIYWTYLLVKNTRLLQNDDRSCVGEMLCLLFVPFYYLYWWYTRGEVVKKSLNEYGYTSTGSGIAYLILGIFGLNIVSMAIMQDDCNSFNENVKITRSLNPIACFIGTIIAMIAAVALWITSTRLDDGIYTLYGWICLIVCLVLAWLTNKTTG